MQRNDESSVGPKDSQLDESEPRKEGHQANGQLVKVNDIHFRPGLDSNHGDMIQEMTATLAKNHHSKGKRCLGIDKQISRQMISLNSMKVKQLDSATNNQLDQITQILEQRHEHSSILRNRRLGGAMPIRSTGINPKVSVVNIGQGRLQPAQLEHELLEQESK